MLDKTENGAREAAAQYENIVELVEALNDARKVANESEILDTIKAVEDAERAIHEDPRSVMVRDGWRQPGAVTDSDNGPEEFEILLCTGGPAVRIRGTLNDYAEPEDAWIEHQDWFTPWQRWEGKPGNGAYRDTLLTYCSQILVRRLG